MQASALTSSVGRPASMKPEKSAVLVSLFRLADSASTNNWIQRNKRARSSRFSSGHLLYSFAITWWQDAGLLCCFGCRAIVCHSKSDSDKSNRVSSALIWLKITISFAGGDTTTHILLDARIYDERLEDSTVHAKLHVLSTAVSGYDFLSPALTLEAVYAFCRSCPSLQTLDVRFSIPTSFCRRQ